MVTLLLTLIFLGSVVCALAWATCAILDPNDGLLVRAWDYLGAVGNPLLGTVDRIHEWLTRHDDQPDRSYSFGLIAGWWSWGKPFSIKPGRPLLIPEGLRWKGHPRIPPDPADDPVVNLL